MMTDSQKNKTIELWRGISIALVVAYHYTNRVPHEYMNSQNPPSIEFYTGKIGVYIFFVISGLLIAKSIAASKSVAEFYSKRLTRIWPLFIVACVVIFGFLQFLAPPIVPDGPKKFFEEPRTIIDLFANFFFLSDLGFNWIDGVFWSILVELKFYLFVGLAAFFIGPRYITAFSWAAVAISMLDFTVFLMTGEPDGGIINKIIHGVLIGQYLPFFAIGMLMFKKDYGPVFIANLFCASLQFVLVTGSNPDLNVLGTIKFVLLMGAIFAADSLLLSGRIFLFLGKYSYSIYLFHQMIGLSIARALAPSIGLDMAILAALAFILVLSWCASQMVEWRFRKPVSAGLMRAFSILRLDRLTLAVKEPDESASNRSATSHG